MTVAIVGGYRLVRKVGHGRRAEVWLGHPLDGGDEPPVAVKLFHGAVTPESASREIEALARAAGPHVVAVRDIATTVDGRCAIVLERLSARTLATVLADRGRLRPGEAVTVLAPLAQAIARMHAAGVVHGAITAAAVGFTDHGAPVLMAFGSAETRPPATEAARGVDPAIREDAFALQRLCAEILAPIVGAEAVLQWLDDRMNDPTAIDELPARLFAWSEPQPVDVASARAPEVRAIEPLLARPRRQRSRLGTVQDAVGLAMSTDWVATIRRHAAVVRPRFWVAGGAVAAALIVAVAVIPAPSDASASGPGAEPATTVSPTPVPEQSAVTGEDPVAALETLLATRERCIRELSVLCLDAVGQQGSSALARDQELIRSIQAGEQGGEEISALGVIDEIVLEESLGGTALLLVTVAGNSEPASILVMRGEAGWRIRDYLDGG